MAALVPAVPCESPSSMRLGWAAEEPPCLGEPSTNRDREAQHGINATPSHLFKHEVYSLPCQLASSKLLARMLQARWDWMVRRRHTYRRFVLRRSGACRSLFTMYYVDRRWTKKKKIHSYPCVEAM
jgi:hypothetical protein